MQKDAKSHVLLFKILGALHEEKIKDENTVELTTMILGDSKKANKDFYCYFYALELACKHKQLSDESLKKHIIKREVSLYTAIIQQKPIFKIPALFLATNTKNNNLKNLISLLDLNKYTALRCIKRENDNLKEQKKNGLQFSRLTIRKIENIIYH